MYRQYEDPWKLEDRLEDAKRRLEIAKQEDPDNDDRIIDLVLEVQELEERVNFAWQDQEYDENYAHDMGYDQESGWEEIENV